jgi:hypothetical protein
MMDSSLHSDSSLPDDEQTALLLDRTDTPTEVHPGIWQYVALGLAMGGLYTVYVD